MRPTDAPQTVGSWIHESVPTMRPVVASSNRCIKALVGVVFGGELWSTSRPSASRPTHAARSWHHPERYWSALRWSVQAHRGLLALRQRLEERLCRTIVV